MTSKCVRGAFPVQSSLGPGSAVKEKAKKKTASEESGAVFWGRKGWRPFPLPSLPLGRFSSQFHSDFFWPFSSHSEPSPWLVQSSRGALRPIKKTKLMKKRQEPQQE